MNKWYLSVASVACYGWTGGDAITGYAAGAGNDAFIPEQWANEGLAILEENMVMANLVSRDFEADVKNYGDVVNTRRAGTFTITRKADGDTLVPETAAATNVPVRLDQWFYKNFVIKDGEASLSFQDLVDAYLTPAMQVIARSVDRAIMGRIHAFLGAPADRAGTLMGLTAATSYDDVLEARQILNENLAPMQGRNLVLSSAAETALLKNTMFVKANERGDGGSALENAVLGRIAGFSTYLDQNVNSCTTGADTAAGTLTEAYPAGTTGAMLSGLAGVVAGEFLVVAGNDQPTWVVTPVEATSVVLNEASKYATEDNAVITRYKACAVGASGLTADDYPVGYSKSILLSGYTSGKQPAVGQLLAFGATAGTRHTYTIIESVYVSGTSCRVTLDRPLEVLVADGATSAFPGPYGSMNWAFHRDAIALVSRPLALPSPQMGVMAHVGVHNGISMRIAAQYDIDAGGTKVNLDLLCGVAVLNSGLCVPLLG
jgi:hypothetical protein